MEWDPLARCLEANTFLRVTTDGAPSPGWGRRDPAPPACQQDSGWAVLTDRVLVRLPGRFGFLTHGGVYAAGGAGARVIEIRPVGPLHAVELGVACHALQMARATACRHVFPSPLAHGLPPLPGGAWWLRISTLQSVTRE